MTVTAKYRQYLDAVRQAFPQPVSDRFHDAYVVFSVLRALDRVDAKKSEMPFLGTAEEIDVAGALDARMDALPKKPEEVIDALVDHLEGMYVWGHPRCQVNVVPPTSIPSVIASLLSAMYNPNLCSEESSRKIALAEVKVSAMTARLVGYEPARSAGLFTFGGTGANLYGARIGLEKALPGSLERGLTGRAVIVGSDQSHYSRYNLAGWLGLGENNAIDVPTNAENAIRLDALEDRLRGLIREGAKIACLIATLGTTDAFGIDDLAGVVALRDRLAQEFQLDYVPHVHADAVIGWAWSVFEDYDFEANPLGFRPRTVRALAKACRHIGRLRLADSIAVDFHKTGFAPYVSSLFLVKERADLKYLARDPSKMPYLYQTGTYHPGMMTLETSRPGSGPLAALANLLLLGIDGLRATIGYLVELAEVLREELEGHASTSVLNGDNVGTVTLFRAYPDGVDTFTVKERERSDLDYSDRLREHNAFNRRIFEYLNADALRGDGVFISITDCYRTSAGQVPINALKSYILSPFANEADIRLLVDKVLQIRQRVQGEMGRQQA